MADPGRRCHRMDTTTGNYVTVGHKPSKADIYG
jgi:hypothetical protein